MKLSELLVNTYPRDALLPSKDCFWPLHVACSWSVTVEIMDLLLCDSVALLQVRDAEGRLALHCILGTRESRPPHAWLDRVLKLLVRGHPSPSLSEFKTMMANYLFTLHLLCEVEGNEKECEMLLQLCDAS